MFPVQSCVKLDKHQKDGQQLTVTFGHDPPYKKTVSDVFVVCCVILYYVFSCHPFLSADVNMMFFVSSYHIILFSLYIDLLQIL